MTYYGQDYMLEDRTGQLDGSDFEDVHDRIRLTLRCTQNAQTHAVYMIYDHTRTAAFNFNNPLAVFDFGPNGKLGTVSFKTGVHTPMKQYLVKVSAMSKYVNDARDIYCWSHRLGQSARTKVHSAGRPGVSVELAHQSWRVDGQHMQKYQTTSYLMI
jgi:hypothetical protein